MEELSQGCVGHAVCDSDHQGEELSQGCVGCAVSVIVISLKLEGNKCQGSRRNKGRYIYPQSLILEGVLTAPRCYLLVLRGYPDLLCMLFDGAMGYPDLLWMLFAGVKGVHKPIVQAIFWS